MERYMSEKTYYMIEVYLPWPLPESGLLESLERQWSTAFGGTTMYQAEGTYIGEPAERVWVLRVYVPATFDRTETIDYFTARREKLERRFNQRSVLVTFSEGYHFL
jgi:hypothetical protein